MNFKLPPGIDPPPLNSVESALTYKMSGYIIDAPFDEYQALNAFMELQRPLIEARRRLAQEQAQAQAESPPL